MTGEIQNDDKSITVSGSFDRRLYSVAQLVEPNHGRVAGSSPASEEPSFKEVFQIGKWKMTSKDDFSTLSRGE